MSDKRARTGNFGPSGFKFTVWSYELQETDTQEDTLDPRFWRDVAAAVMGVDKINPNGRGNEIRCWKPDTSHLFYLVIVEIGPGYIKTKLIRDAGAEAVKPLPENSPLSVKWNPGKKSHDVIRAGDNTVLKAGFQTKQAAAEWIADHLKSMAA